jgi:hypothetical protein
VKKKIQTVTIQIVGRNAEKREHFSTVGGSGYCYSHHGKQYGGSPKN